MIVLKHPVATDIILMSTTYTEDFTFIGHKSPAELWNQEFIEKNNLFRRALINIIKMNIFSSPFKIMN